MYLFNHFKTSAPIGAWKWNFPLFKEIITDRQTDRPTNQSTDRRMDRRAIREIFTSNNCVIQFKGMFPGKDIPGECSEIITFPGNIPWNCYYRIAILKIYAKTLDEVLNIFNKFSRPGIAEVMLQVWRIRHKLRNGMLGKMSSV